MKLFLLSVLIVPALLCNAQKPASLPEFGKVDKATLEMKECSFEKNAEAMVVFDEAESYLNLNLNSPTIPIFEQTSYHTRIKIFGKKGFDHANIKIKYRNDPDISIKKLHAQTYNIDAAGNVVVTKVEKSAIYDKQINKRYSEKIFVFPDVKEGSVLEYEYVLEGASAGVWYFQKNIPVAFSRFIVDFSPEISVAVTPYSSLPVNKSNNRNATNNYSWYTMENVPAFIDEPYMSAPKDYLQRLDLDITGLSLPGMPYKSFIKTWPKIVRTLVEDEDFGRQLKKEIPRTSDLDKMLQNITDDFQKMKIIHKYVRSNMKWNNLDNIWALDGVKVHGKIK
ncbi:MAG: DUF3857 domain-containing protein [Chitinophagaceae bacterium]|nr:DUF3857 domain-containing protein [Chitinophagaceae bacterium]